MAIQMHHADENFEKCLEVLEESQRIVKTHYGTQSSEVSSWQFGWQYRGPNRGSLDLKHSKDQKFDQVFVASHR